MDMIHLPNIVNWILWKYYSRADQHWRYFIHKVNYSAEHQIWNASMRHPRLCQGSERTDLEQSCELYLATRQVQQTHKAYEVSSGITVFGGSI